MNALLKKIGSLNIENLREMILMFNGCSSLKELELNLSSFNTNYIISALGLFFFFFSLEEMN